VNTNKGAAVVLGLEGLPSKHEVMGSSSDKSHWWCQEEHLVIIAPVPHLNKSLTRFNKNPFYQGFTHRDVDNKLAW